MKAHKKADGSKNTLSDVVAEAKTHESANQANNSLSTSQKHSRASPLDHEKPVHVTGVGTEEAFTPGHPAHLMIDV